MRPWPKGAVEGKAVTRAFVDAYRLAFDADPEARYCAGEIDGITIIVAVGETGKHVQKLVVDAFGGRIQRAKPGYGAATTSNGEPVAPVSGSAPSSEESK